MKQRSFKLTSFKALDQGLGIFEALVAVFGNVDRGGEKILPGAFTKSLAAWAQRGRPIPVIFSHDWGNLDAHIGEVREAKELPDGLYVKGQLEMDEPFAARVWKKMARGTLAEFSFAYDVVDATLVKGADGAYVNELRELELLEVGPCLVGMNPETQLLGVKEGRRNSATDAARIQAIHDVVCELGAKCSASGDGGAGGAGEGAGQGEAGNGKPKGLLPSTLAARVALELIEAGY
jgi:HK97 family phage prohead protease